MKKSLKSISGILLLDAIFGGLLVLPQVREKMAAVILFGVCLLLMTVLNLVDNLKHFNQSNEEHKESVCMKVLYYMGIAFAVVGGIVLIIG